jgi:hypothetical protein
LTEKFDRPYGVDVSIEGVHTLVRRTHEERVLHVLREHGALSRGQITA